MFGYNKILISIEIFVIIFIFGCDLGNKNNKSCYCDNIYKYLSTGLKNNRLNFISMDSIRDELVASNCDSFDFAKLMGFTYNLQGYKNKSKEYFNKALEIDSLDTYSNFIIGSIYYEEKLFDSAFYQYSGSFLSS